MSITGVSGYSSTLSLAELLATQNTDSVSSTGITSSGTSSSRSTSKCDSIDLSKPSDIYAKLEELAKTDPEKLKSAAETADGPGAEMLSNLAEKFQNVSEGGDVSQLKPPEPPDFSDRQPPIEKYSQQQDAQSAGIMGGQPPPGGGGGQHGRAPLLHPQPAQ
jgi:hypothetical protein